MPQLLHFLQVDKTTTVIDGGSDSNSAQENPQPPLPTEDQEATPPQAPVIVSGSFHNKSDKVPLMMLA